MATTTEGVLFSTRPGPKLVRVARRGPLLRPSPTTAGVYGLDLTAGCEHSCPFCHIRGASRYPGDGRVLFDPFSSEKLADALDALDLPPARVVLSPSSDPLPASREVRAETLRVTRVLLERGVPLQMMTRGRFSGSLIELLASRAELVKVAVALCVLDRPTSRVLEPRAASPSRRLADIRRMVAAGLDVEVRLEPLIPGRTDGRDQIAPLFREIVSTGAKRVLFHYLYLHPKLSDGLGEAFSPLPWGEALRDEFEGGPVSRLGSIGPVKHLPLDVRRAGLARLIAWGAEAGLSVATGSSQNPDLPLSGDRA